MPSLCPQSDKGGKWAERARVGCHLGRSPVHACNVGLVLNIQTARVSPQFHIQADQLVPLSQEINETGLVPIHMDGGSRLQRKTQGQASSPSAIKWQSPTSAVSEGVRPDPTSPYQGPALATRAPTSGNASTGDHLHHWRDNNRTNRTDSWADAKGQTTEGPPHCHAEWKKVRAPQQLMEA